MHLMTSILVQRILIGVSFLFRTTKISLTLCCLISETAQMMMLNRKMP